MSWLRSFSLRRESLVRVREKFAGGGATNARETSAPPPPISGKFRPLEIISKQDWNTFWPFNTVKCQTITLSAVFAWYNIISTFLKPPIPLSLPPTHFKRNQLLDSWRFLEFRFRISYCLNTQVVRFGEMIKKPCKINIRGFRIRNHAISHSESK